MKKEYVKFFSQNLIGQDYVVGDIHGTFHDLEQLLKTINFNPITDRLFSVGDLCDRGPNSNDILKWLNYDWFFPVMGNHEEIILDYLNGSYDKSDMFRFGSEWFLSTSDIFKKELAKKYSNLPIAIEIETKNGLVGVIHAECPYADWNSLRTIFNGPHKNKMIQNALWSTMAPLQDDVILGVHAVIVGHMTQNEYMQRGNVHFIDTGNCYGHGYFTILNINTFEIFTNKYGHIFI